MVESSGPAAEPVSAGRSSGCESRRSSSSSTRARSSDGVESCRSADSSGAEAKVKSPGSCLQRLEVLDERAFLVWRQRRAEGVPGVAVPDLPGVERRALSLRVVAGRHESHVVSIIDVVPPPKKRGTARRRIQQILQRRYGAVV